MIANPILRTKLYVPPYRAGWVLRPDLIARLNSGLLSKLILLSAPAGFGKTTLLCEWIQQIKICEGSNARTQFAWLSLDEGDNDVSRFLAYLTGALRSIDKGLYAKDLVDAGFAQPQSSQAILNDLINRVDEQQRKEPEGSQAVLVLDDYHVITEEPVHQSLVYLIDHLPPQMHLVIASRADPPLSLARLRARSEIYELRASELRFSTVETREFTNNVMGLNLSDMDIAALENRTEGWIAGLQMAALAMQSLSGGEREVQDSKKVNKASTSNYSSFIQHLSGSNRYIMDYLIEEVLQRQSATVQDFLLKTSILERMCSPLCAAVIGETIEEEQRIDLSWPIYVLNYLDRANLFVFPLDDRREWYRYHQLFADLLRKRLNLAFPEQVPDLHQRASEWFEQNGALEEAIEHAFAANDEKRTIELVAKAAEGLMIRSEFLILQRWLDRLPDEQIATQPTLCVFHAWLLFLNNSPLHKLEERLALIQAYDETQTIKAAPLRAYIAAYRGLMPQASNYAQQALDGLPEKEIFLRSMAHIILATCELSDGDPEAGYRAFEQAVHFGDQTGNVLASVMALAGLAENYRKQGQLHQAEVLYRQALDLAVDSSGKRLPIAGRALCGLGELMREWNRLEESERFLEEGIELLKDWGALVIYSGYIILARLKQAQRKLPEAMEIVQEVRQLAEQTKVTPIDDWIVDMAQASLWIAHGDLDLAEAWAERRGLLHEPDPTGLFESEIYAYAHLRKYESIVLARLRLALGQREEALQLLDFLLPEVIKTSRVGLRIEIQLLRALTLYSMGRRVEAFSALEAALSLAEPAGYIRIFLDEGSPMHHLLSEVHRRNPSSAYVASLLAVLERELPAELDHKVRSKSPPAVSDEIEPLSEREIEILSLLRSRLTVPEMAETLYIAESTVRSHIKNIYSKLAVHRRMDAIQRAEELGLLSRIPS
jgi:LuxR family maltose regulon positive regulatory protein